MFCPPRPIVVRTRHTCVPCVSAVLAVRSRVSTHLRVSTPPPSVWLWWGSLVHANGCSVQAPMGAYSGQYSGTCTFGGDMGIQLPKMHGHAIQLVWELVVILPVNCCLVLGKGACLSVCGGKPARLCGWLIVVPSSDHWQYRHRNTL